MQINIEGNKSKRNNTKFIYTFLVLLSALSVCAFTGISYSKYVHEQYMLEMATIASPLFISSSLMQNDTPYILELENCSPSMGVQSYSFGISNFSGVLVSETAISYVITIETSGNLPLVISLKKGAELLSTLTIIENTFSSDAFAFGTDATTDDYSLDISWDPLQMGSEFAGLIDVLSISVLWTQID